VKYIKLLLTHSSYDVNHICNIHMKTILIFILVDIIIAALAFAFIYAYRRKRWLVHMRSIFNRFLFFSILMIKINSKQALQYDIDALNNHTMKSSYALFFKFWVWNTEGTIKNREFFDYLIATTKRYSFEFSLYWKLFIEDNMDFTANNVKSYNDMIKSANFKKMAEPFEIVPEESPILH